MRGPRRLPSCHGGHGTDETAPRRARQSRRARRARCRRLPLPTRPATCRACARGRTADPLRLARCPPSHHGTWKVAGVALASKVQNSTALPNGRGVPNHACLIPRFSLLAHTSAVDRPLSRGAGPYRRLAPPAGSVPSRPCPIAQAQAVIGDTPVRLWRRVSAVNRPLTRWAGPH